MSVATNLPAKLSARITPTTHGEWDCCLRKQRIARRT